MGKRILGAVIVCAAMALMALAPMALSQIDGTVHEIVKGPKGPKASAVTWEFEAPDYGVWYGHIVNDGLRSLVVDVYDTTTGAPIEELHQRIRFAAYPSGPVDTYTVEVAVGHTYSVTGTPNGPQGSMCTVEDIFRGAVPPVAVIDVLSIDYLDVVVDGSGSSDDVGIASYAWDFGDGATAMGMSASHSYAWDGTYTITLTVTDTDGLTDDETVQVTVEHEPMPPVAMFTADMDWMTVSVDAAGSYDPDRWIETWDWEFGDGAVASGETATHTYATPGWYTIVLTVTDDDGLTGTASEMVEAREPVPPVAMFTADPVYMDVTVNAGGSYDPDGTIESYGWSFGDGAVASGVMATHTYATPGWYTIVLTVTDNDGLTGTASEMVEATEPPELPVASFTADIVWMDVSVDASASYDLDGTIESYEWDFGDGGIASGVTATHTYAMEGWYTIVLTVTDNDGLTGTASEMVEAIEEPPLVPPVASFTWTPNYLEVTFDATGSSDSDGTIVSYDWDFGDGGMDSGMIVTHTFAMDGTYSVTLTVTDNDALTGMKTELVPVEGYDAPPVADFEFVVDGMTVTVTSTSTDDKGIVSWEWDWGDGSPLGSGETASHTYVVTASVPATTAAATPNQAPPPPPYEIFGYTYDEMANPVPGTTVTVTNLRTGDVAVVYSDATAFYRWNLWDFPNTWAVGDEIHVLAENAGLSGEATAIATGGAYIWQDVTMYSTGGSADFWITLTVTDTMGQTATVTKMVTVTW